MDNKASLVAWRRLHSSRTLLRPRAEKARVTSASCPGNRPSVSFSEKRMRAEARTPWCPPHLFCPRHRPMLRMRLCLFPSSSPEAPSKITPSAPETKVCRPWIQELKWMDAVLQSRAPGPTTAASAHTQATRTCTWHFTRVLARV